MIELYIEDEKVDLSGDEKIGLDYAIFDISDIGGRKGSRSYSFKLPMTNRNRSIFGSSEIVQTLTDKPFVKLNAKLFDFGIDLGIKYCELTQASNNYEVRLYGSNSNFYSQLKGFNLSDLNYFKGLTHFWDLPSIVASWSYTTGYIYPAIDLHADSPNAYIDNTTSKIYGGCMLPFVYVDEVIDNIVSDAGYTLNNTIKNNPIYSANALIFGGNDGALKRTDNGDIYKGSVKKTNANPTTGTYFSQSTWSQCYFDTIVFGDSYNWLSTSLTNYNTIAFSDSVKINLSGSIVVRNYASDPGYNDPIDFKIRVRNANGVTQFESTIISIQRAVSPATYTELVYTFSANDLIFDAVSPTTNELYVEGIITTPLLFVNDFLRFSDDSTIAITKCEVLETQPIVFNSNIESLFTINSIIPKYKQSDFLKHYCQLFNLIISVDEVNRIVSLIPFKTITDNIYQALDWSNKVDNTEISEVIFRSEKYSQNNNFRYKDDQTIVKPFGTDAVIHIDDEWLEDESDYIQVGFSASEKTERFNGVETTLIPIFEAQEIKNKVEPKILLLDKQNFSIIITNDGTTGTTMTTDVPIAKFINTDLAYSLGFGNNLLDKFSSDIVSIMQNYRLVRVKMRLNASDINQLDFLKPIYLSQHNSYFYLSSIKGFRPGGEESCICEFVKLNVNG